MARGGQLVYHMVNKYIYVNKVINLKIWPIKLLSAAPGCLLISLALSASIVSAARAHGSELKDIGSNLTVRTAYGAVAGELAGGVRVFRGIPFAAPPVGTLRFRAPEPPAPWSGVRPARAFGPPCAQDGSPTEDCLYLNIWTPARATAGARPRPVMVWIHGGALTSGSSSFPLYNGARLAKRGDLLVVSIDYRLGLLGFLDLTALGGPKFAGSANAGILDQIAALRWIHHNIAAFGGDPANVTIFGQSAGGSSVYALLGAPAARGLFAKAIMESGAPVEFITRRAAEDFARLVLKRAGVATVAQLQSMPVQRLLDIQSAAYHGQSACMSYDDVVFREPPLTAIANGTGGGVPLMVGTTLDELGRGGPIAGVAVAPNMTFYDPLIGMSADELRERLDITLPRATTGRIMASYLKRYPAFPEAVARLRGDIIYRLPSIRIAEVNSRAQPTYMYLFALRTPVSPAHGDKIDVSLHMAELPFVFDTPSLIYVGTHAQQEHLIDEVQSAWIRFAETGDPNTTGHPYWPKYDVRKRATMRFDIPESTVVDDPEAADRLAWARVSFHDLTSIDAQEWFLNDLQSVRQDHARRN